MEGPIRGPFKAVGRNAPMHERLSRENTRISSGLAHIAECRSASASKINKEKLKEKLTAKSIDLDWNHSGNEGENNLNFVPYPLPGNKTNVVYNCSLDISSVNIQEGIDRPTDSSFGFGNHINSGQASTANSYDTSQRSQVETNDESTDISVPNTNIH